MADRHAPGVSVFRDRPGIAGADRAGPSAAQIDRSRRQRQAGCTRRKTDQGLYADEPGRARQSKQWGEEERSCSPGNTSGAASSATKVFAKSPGTLPMEAMSLPVTRDKPGKWQIERYPQSLASVPSETRKQSRPESRLAWVQTYASWDPTVRVIEMASGARQRSPCHLKYF